MNFLLNFTLQPCIFRGVLFFIMVLCYAQGDITGHSLRPVFPRLVEEPDVSLSLKRHMRSFRPACVVTSYPVVTSHFIIPSFLSSRAKRGNLHINNLRGEIRRAGYEHFCFYFSSLYILCITLPPVKTIILTASIEKSSASTIHGLSSLPSARTL